MNKNIVFTAGTFDLFHYGHLRFLKRIKKIANKNNAKLVVGISTDELVKSYKKYTPIIDYSHRVEIVNGCKFVDKTVKQTVLIGTELLKKLKPKIIVTLSNFKNLKGIKWAKQNNIKIIYINYTKGISTTTIKKRITSV